MCGRFGLFDMRGLVAQFDLAGEPPEFEPSYNVAPGVRVPVVTRNSPNRANLMQWGLVPFWSQDARGGYKMINARAEGIESKPAFRRPVRGQRCLVPANGFYEWRREAPGDGAPKTPFFIRLIDREIFAFAGLYDIWRDADGREVWSFTIITTVPNALMAPIHNRMPVILRQEDQARWLDSTTGLADVLALLAPYPAGQMAAYPVSTLVNSPRNNGPELVRPV